MKYHFLLALACMACWTAPAMADESLAKSKNCMVCHSADRKVMGPAFKDVAAKYDDASAVAASIKNGSKGKWGAIPMPPNKVSDEEAQKLAMCILSLK